MSSRGQTCHFVRRLVPRHKFGNDTRRIKTGVAKTWEAKTGKSGIVEVKKRKEI